MPTLRTPTKSDLEALASLGRDTFIETFGHLYSPKDLNSFLTSVYSDACVAEELADSKLIHRVIEEDSRLIAFAKIGPVHVPVENPAPGAMELWQIYVRKNNLGQGHGDKLMAWAFEHFRAENAPEIYVSVFSENERAIRFYQKYGFEKCGEYDFLVGDHIDLEWIMRCSPKWTDPSMRPIHSRPD